MTRLLIALFVFSVLGMVVLALVDLAALEALLSAAGSLWDAGVAALCEVADAAHTLETEAWTWFPGKMRAVLGAFECMRCLLLFVGLLLFGGARHMLRRFL